MKTRFLAGLAVSAAISLAGWRAKALSGRGALAATGVGTGVAVGSSWPGLVVLGTFFISSSAISSVGVSSDVEAKGSRRDERQVLANGLVATIGALVGARLNQQAAVTLVAGALAAATADTWATEVGSRSRSTPRLLRSGLPVARGTSGGVTRRGLVASLAGASLTGGVAGLLVGRSGNRRRAIAIGSGVVTAGLAGSLADSLLGEAVQERRRCALCGTITEMRVHRCGSTTEHIGGIPGVDNDIVNLACTLIGGIVVLPFVLDR